MLLLYMVVGVVGRFLRVFAMFVVWTMFARACYVLYGAAMLLYGSACFFLHFSGGIFWIWFLTWVIF